MKQTKKLFSAALMIIAAMTIPVRYASAQQTDGNARDLARALGSKTTVNGDTVTLTGGVQITKSLVVPEGVTLDLTKQTLTLGNKAVFTVNGTVNSKAGGININSAAANAAVINGSGTVNLKSKGNLLNIGKGKKLTLDGVTLVGLEDNNESLVNASDGGELVLKSGAITGNKNNGNGGGGGVRLSDGTFTMTGGTISGNSISVDGARGGGVLVERGTFTMTGGMISDNTSTGSGSNGSLGGGVRLEWATFIMTGGTITGNTVAGVDFVGGGGVHITRESTFTMTGGTISANTVIARNRNTGDGGGVLLWEGSTFIMDGGTIYGNAVSLPTGADVSLANSTSRSSASLEVDRSSTAKWGTGGTYTKGGVSQSGGSNISSTNDTLIAIPSR